MKLMKLSRSPRLTLAVALSLAQSAAFAAALPASSRTKVIDKTVALDGRSVRLDSNAADVEVVASAGQSATLHLELEYWSSNDEWMETVEREFDVDVEEFGGEVIFRQRNLNRLREEGWFKRLFGGNRVSYSIEIRLAVPVGTELEIENRYGKVSVADIGGPLAIDNNSGVVDVRGAAGRVEIENRYAKVAVTDSSGALDLQVNSGTVEVDRFDGSARVSNRYAEVRIEDVSGDLDLESGSGRLSVESIGGSAEISGSYAAAEVSGIGGALDLSVSSGDVTVERVAERVEIRSSYGKTSVGDVGGDLVVRSTSGAVAVFGVRGSAKIGNSYGEVRVENVDGDADVNNQSGGVTMAGIGGLASIVSSYDAVRVRGAGGLEVSSKSAGVTGTDIRGGADVTTSYAGVRLDGVAGPVSVRNNSGRVEVTGLSGAALESDHRVETTYAEIVFEWPASGPVPGFDLDCSYCSLESDFPATYDKSGSRRSATGEGSGPGGVTLSSTSGSVFLRKR